MAAVADELTLLERVFLCLGNANTDEQLEASVCKFLVPILLKLSSPEEAVRKKVMSLLIHINRRVKSRPKIRLPVEALLLRYGEPSAGTFVINFMIIYIKMGYARMETEKQVELIPKVLRAVRGKPLAHRDSLLLIITPVLGKLEIPEDAEKRAALLGIADEPAVAKDLLDFSMDTLLLPYGSVGQTGIRGGSGQTPGLAVPPGLSEYAFKRVVGEEPPSAEKLEQMKLGIVKFLAGGFFKDAEILAPLVVAAADTRFSVANAADYELKKIGGGLDWSSRELVQPLYDLFLGTEATSNGPETAPENRRLAANTRIRLKIMHYLCRVSNGGFVVPTCVDIIRESLDETNSNRKLQSLALQFTLNMVQQCDYDALLERSGILMRELTRIIGPGERENKGMGFTILGNLGQRIFSLVNKDLSLLECFFKTLVEGEPEVRKNVQDAAIRVTSAFVLGPEDANGMEMMDALLSMYVESPEASARSLATHFAATVFPPEHAPSRYLLLLASGDEKDEISGEATKALYETSGFPEFPVIVDCVRRKMKTRMERTANRKFVVGNTSLPYNLATLIQIINYLRLCLGKSAKISSTGSPVEHPSEESPAIGRYLEKLFAEQPNILQSYLDIIMPLNRATSDAVALRAFLEIVGTTPPGRSKLFVEDSATWLKTSLASYNVVSRILAARIYGIIIADVSGDEDFAENVESLKKNLNAGALENRHGLLVALASMLERKLIIRRNSVDGEILPQWKSYVDVVEILHSFASNESKLLKETAVRGIGALGKIFSLPLAETGNDECVTKEKIVHLLFAIFRDDKTDRETREGAVFSLGQLCVGEIFPYAKMIAEEFLKFAKETKDVSMHLAIAESLVLCVQGTASPEARDAWTTLPEEHAAVPCAPESDRLLAFVLQELLKISRLTHPNSRQAVCVWLLALVKHNSKRPEVTSKLCEIHNSFLDLLSENNDMVQDVAAKGLGLVYDTSKPEDRQELAINLSNRFSRGKKIVAETKLSEEEESTVASGANLSTFREIFALASDVKRPELAYRFMHLANHSSIWESKKGAALGLAAIGNNTDSDLRKEASSIVPKLYRYQFDPSPKTQQCMSRIWKTIVPSNREILEQYRDEILDDIEANLTSAKFRVRSSCCLALADLLQSGVSIDLPERCPALWKQLFYVMDDTHEETRARATTTAKILSKMCVRNCDVSRGKSAELLLAAVLPILLEIGTSHAVPIVRSVSLQTVSQLVAAAGSTLKPYLVNLVPALVTATDLENTQLNYMSNRYGGEAEIREAIDSVRASAAKSHYAIETLTKCTRYIDESVLRDLMPKVIELIESSISLGSKVALSHLLTCLSTSSKQELKPYAGKLLSALASGLTDRNGSVRKMNAATIGYVIGSAKRSSQEKLFNRLRALYDEREDEATRLAIGLTLRSVNDRCNEVARENAEIFIPLTFLAMHAEKTSGNEESLECWKDLWGDVAHGTEYALRKYLTGITMSLKNALESSSWTTKAQAANCVSTLAGKLGTSMEEEARKNLLIILEKNLRGRTWNGKERVVDALATLVCNGAETLKNDAELTSMVLEALYRESRKESPEYRRRAIVAFARVVDALGIDRFSQLYEIAREIIVKSEKKSEEDEEEEEASEEIGKRREDKLKLEETVYEALGKAWPSSLESKDTQEENCVNFVGHCNRVLRSTTRPVQAAILTSLNLFVDKFFLLEKPYDEMDDRQTEILATVCRELREILEYSLGLSKFTRIRKEALNMIISLSKKLAETGNTTELKNLTSVFANALPDLSNDNQPEVRTRVTDIKKTLSI